MHRDYEKQLRNYHQAKWNEELIFDLSVPGERGVLVTPADASVIQAVSYTHLRLYGQDEEDPKQDRTGTEETDDIGCFDRYSGFDLLWRNGDDFMGLFIFRI